MDEEQPNFKVTDRRLFNADGSPRDLPPEERPEPKPEAVETVTANAATAATGAQTEPAPAPASAPPPVETADEAEEEFTEEELADARDPAGFISFIMSIASNAAS